MTGNLLKHLSTSIALYQEVLLQMRKIATAVESNNGNLTEMVQLFTQMQARAQQHDQQLIPLLEQAGSQVKQLPLYGQRLELIAEVLKLNHLLLPKINGMMALVSHELTELKANRNALGGYKPVTHKQGRIVKSSA